MTLWVFNAKTLPCHPPEATHATGSVPHIYTKGDSLSSICGGGVPGLALGISASVGAPRERSCAHRERWGQLSFRAGARGGSGCRRSYARSGPVPLPLRGGAGILGEDEAFGVPQRGSAYQPGVKPRRRGRSLTFTKKGTVYHLFQMADWRGWRWGSVPRRGLRGIGPALAGNVGASWAFARPREGNQGVDVPMLAPARSRCRPGRPTESVTFPKADPSQRVGTGFLAASLTARVFVGSGNLNSQLGSTS